MKTRLQATIGFAVFVFFVLGCSAINKIQKQVSPPQVLTATDGSCQITVPGNWKTETSLNKQAILQASNRVGEQYIVVIRENKKDFGNLANLDLVTNVIRESLKKNLLNPVFSDPVGATVSGFPAKQFEASGEVQNIKVKYLYSVTETPQNFYQIITWTLTSRFDSNRSELMEVINSFKETGGNQPPPSSGGNTLKR